MIDFPKDIKLNNFGVPKEMFLVYGGQVIRCDFVRQLPRSFGGRTIFQYDGPPDSAHVLLLSFQEVNPPLFLREKDAEGYAINSLVF